jgi:hypothetical protein
MVAGARKDFLWNQLMKPDMLKRKNIQWHAKATSQLDEMI